MAEASRDTTISALKRLGWDGRCTVCGRKLKLSEVAEHRTVHGRGTVTQVRGVCCSSWNRQADPGDETDAAA